MNQQALEKRDRRVTTRLPVRNSADQTLERIWEEVEAERIVIAQIPLNPVPQRSEPDANSERARYAYD